MKTFQLTDNIVDHHTGCHGGGGGGVMKTFHLIDDTVAHWAAMVGGGGGGGGGGLMKTFHLIDDIVDHHTGCHGGSQLGSDGTGHGPRHCSGPVPQVRLCLQLPGWTDGHGQVFGVSPARGFCDRWL